MLSVLASRFEEELKAHAPTIWLRCGLFDEFGPLGEHFTGRGEGHQLINEIAGRLLQALLLDVCERLYGVANRGVGCPRDPMVPCMAGALLGCYLRFHDSAGRHSVLTSDGSRLLQMEAGPFFEFLQAVLAPLNNYLVVELHRRPISPARVARYALAHRDSGL